MENNAALVIDSLLSKFGTTIEHLMPAIIDFGRYECKLTIRVCSYLIIAGIIFMVVSYIYRPYDWNFEGEDSERPANLEHKASGFKLWWYKYPLRSADVNMMITYKQFFDILYDCCDSVYTFGSHEIEKWWESAGERS